MECGNCGTINRDGARFCIGCGAPVLPRCASCGEELPAGARFCDSCGAPVAEQATTESLAIRKTVTVFFSDLTGSTALGERMDPESVRTLMAPVYATMRREVESRGGHVAKFVGDGVMAVFGIPDVREDDAVRAVDAAFGMRHAIDQLSADLPSPLFLKVGINTGEIVVGAGDEDIVGDCVNVASRLEGAAAPGEILVGEETWRLTRSHAAYEPVAPLALKGKAQPVPAYRLVSLERTAEAATTTFVGREDEFAKLHAAFEDAVSAQASRRMTIIGSPGLGKTRLAREFGASLSERALVVETRCDIGIATFAPVADALRTATGLAESATPEEVVEGIKSLVPDDGDRERIAQRAGALLGAGEPGSPEETFWAIRRIVETAASVMPMVLILDDLHWGEPLLLDLVEHLAEWNTSAPLLLVVTGRPELREMRPALCEGAISLEGLDENSTEALACGLLGTDRVPPELLARLPESTEGNPLFVREFVRMLVDDGVLRRSDGAWIATIDVDAIQVPPTIQSLLAARVDRLTPHERTVLELASVVGKEFYRGAIAELAPAAVKVDLGAHLESLRRKELVEPAGTYWIDEPVFRFHHALIQDAAYRRLLKEARAELHERVAAWLENKTGALLGEHDELIGYHLEQAHESLVQLGVIDDHTREVGKRAATLLHSAARNALDRDDLPAAASLSGRALARLGAGNSDRPDVLIVRCEALLATGDVSSAAGAVEELTRLATSRRLHAWATCFTGELANLTDPSRLHETEGRVSAAAAELAALGDSAGEAKAHTVHAGTLARLGRVAECESALDRALNAAREAGDRRRITAVLGAAPLAALWGPSPVSRAGGRCLDIVRLLRITTASPAVEATSLRCQAVLEAFRGRPDAARRMLRKARRDVEEIGLRQGLLETEIFAGIVELSAGDPSAAEDHLRRAYEGWRAMGVEVNVATAAALLARAHLQMHEDDEALGFVDESERLGGDDLKNAIAWRSVKAELLARRGELREARRLAEEAVTIAGKTDTLVDHGDACTALANVCRTAGDEAAARRAFEQARALYEQKGATALFDLRAPVVATTAMATAVVKPNRAYEGARRFLDLVAAGRADDLSSLLAPDAYQEDRRKGLSNTLHGREAVFDNYRSLIALGPLVIGTTLLATRGERLAVVKQTVSDPHDEYGVEFLALVETAEDGLFVASVIYDLEDLPAAVAELDERYARGEGAAYAAELHMLGEIVRRTRARDWDGYAQLFSSGAVIADFTPASRGEMDVSTYIATFRELVSMIDDHVMYLQTIDALSRDAGVGTVRNTGRTPDGALIEVSYAGIVRLGEGLIDRVELFPIDQLDNILARFREQETSPILSNIATRVWAACAAAFDVRDWQAMSNVLAVDSVVESRRQGMRNSIRGRDAIVENAKNMAAIGAQRLTVDPLAVRGGDLALFRARAWAPGSDYTVDWLMVGETDENGLLALTINFDADDLGGAFAELDERYSATAPADVRHVLGFGSRLIDAYNRRDWDAYGRVYTLDLVVVDHRPASLGELRGREALVESHRALIDLMPDSALYVADLVRVSPTVWVSDLLNFGHTVDGETVDVSLVAVGVFSSDGIARMELFPVDRYDDALTRARQLDRPAIAVAAHRLWDAIRRSDWDDIADVLAPDVVLRDHRPGLHAEHHGREQLIDLYRATTAVGRDRLDGEVLAVRGDSLGCLREVHGSSDPDVPYEVEVLTVAELDADGRVFRVELFAPEQREEALATLDAWSAPSKVDDGRENHTVRTLREAIACAFAGDWDGFRARHSKTARAVDRRPVLGGGDDRLDEIVETYRFVMSLEGVEIDLVPIAVRGERLALTRTLFHTDRSDFAVEVISVFETDVDGKLVYSASYEPSDLDAAFDELDTRYLEQTDSETLHVGIEFVRAYNARDWDRLSELVEGCIYVDHQPAGVGRLDGSAYVSSIRALMELVPDLRARVIRVVAENDLGTVGHVRVTGTSADGSEINFEWANVAVARSGRFQHFENFAIENLDEAMRRFDDVTRSDPLLPPIFSDEQGRRFYEVQLSGEWEIARSFFAENLITEDRRQGVSSVGHGRERWIKNFQTMHELGFTGANRGEMLAIRGDLLWLGRGAAEDTIGNVLESIVLVEANRDAVITRMTYFDIDDLDAAFDELDDRYLVGEGAGVPALRSGLELLTAINERDWDRVQALTSDDFRYVDHQTVVNFGQMTDRAQWVESLKPLIDLAPNTRARIVKIHAASERTFLGELLATGNTEDGGTFEIRTYIVTQYDAGKMSRVEEFSHEALDAALARFEELRSDSPHG